MDLIKRVRIDKAINALDGNASNAAEGYNNNYNFLRLDELRGYRFVAGGQYYLGESICTRAEFEARKAERQNKPDWKDLPPETQWLGQDRCGKWKPMVGPKPNPERGYWVTHHHLMPQPIGEVIGDWRNTLEQRPNHIGESGEKVKEVTDFALKIGAVAPGCAVRLIRQALPELFDNTLKTDAADWYDYENQTVIKLPPVGAKFELYPFFHSCEVVAHHDGGAVVYDKKALEYVNIKWGNFRCRPLDFNRNQEQPSPSPELSFHLANALNELQAGARLLPDSDPRRGQLVALAGGIGVVKEGA